jgi:hypothetical protein
MTEILAMVAGALTVVVPYTILLRAERARVNELFRLLEARAAPSEFAAYIAEPEPPPAERWVFSEDGLVGIRDEDS